MGENMELSFLIQIISCFLVFFGALCLFLGFITASELKLEEFGKDTLEDRRELIENFFIQKAVLQTGSFLLMSGFFFNLVVLVVPKYKIGLITSNTLGIAMGGMIAFLIFANWLYFNRAIVQNFRKKAEGIITKKRIDDYSA